MVRNNEVVIRDELPSSIIFMILGAIFVCLTIFLDAKMVLSLIVGLAVFVMGIVMYQFKTTFYLHRKDDGIIIVEEYKIINCIRYELELSKFNCRIIEGDILEARDDKNHIIRLSKGTKIFEIFADQIKEKEE